MLLTRHDGEIEFDHRASPGMPGSRIFTEGSVVRLPTIGCPHCRTPQIINPNRVRERAYCRKCDAYICDQCAIWASQPDYVHITFDEIVEKCSAGTHVYIGPIHRARLVPIEQFGALKPP
jgi:hypothetical protein